MAERDLPEVVAARGDLLGCTFLTDSDVGAVVVAVAPAAEPGDGPEPRAGVVDAATLYRVDLAEMAAREHLTGAAGEHVTVNLPRPHRRATDEFPWSALPPRVVLLGIGSGSARDLRLAGATLARATQGLDRVVSVASSDAGPDGVAAFVEGPADEPAPAGAATRLVLLDRAADHEPALAGARAAAAAAWLARDLANEPTDVKDPVWFADRAVRLAAAQGLATTVLGPRELRAAGLGGLLAVASGSAREPRLVTVSYVPAGASRHVVVVGGGTTYDTGGLDVLPRVEMAATTTHAAGAGAALGAVLGASLLGLACRVTAVLPLVENGFGASALRPGDVVTLGSGRTVEVARPGDGARLALADGLAYAARELAPDVLVDVATLTGAVTTALGAGRAALFTPDDALAAAFAGAADATGEGVWRLPLSAEYASSLRSTVADLRDVPAASPGAGAVTAALFLREAMATSRPAVPWAHLDVSGHARRSSAAGEEPEGATGYGARLLLAFLAGLDAPTFNV
jgi:leucyl aminopeptidase